MRASLTCPSRGVPADDHDVTQLQEDILVLLEKADMPEAFSDRIMRIIALEEQRKAGERISGIILSDALAVTFPYHSPQDDPNTLRGEAQRTIMTELGLKVYS